MKRKRLILTLVLCLILGSCANNRPFDPETEGALDVIVQNDGCTQYYAINGSCHKQKTTAFESDALVVYEVDDRCFETYMGLDNTGDGDFISRLTDVRLWDENGCVVQNTRVLNEILLAASELEHDLWKVRILRAGEEYFLYVELNVNWVAPCDLYWYDRERHGLVEVCSLNGWETVGLRVRDLSKFSARPVYLPEREGRRADVLWKWPGGYVLHLTEDGVRLSGPDGVVADRVTGVAGVSVVNGAGPARSWHGAVSEAGYHVLPMGSEKLTTYTSLADVPERYASHFAEESFSMLRRFRYAYGDGNPKQALSGLRMRFEENRTLCTEAVQALYAHPELFDFIRAEKTHYTVREDGQRWGYTHTPGDERFGARGGTPVVYLLDDGFLTDDEWTRVQEMMEAMALRYVGSENGAVFLHFAVMDNSGKTSPARLYYASEEEAAVCAQGWFTWENLGGGWYMGALTNGLH